jgi:FkbM family methyltransferase
LKYLYKLRDEFHFYPNIIYDIGSCILHWSKYASEVWSFSDIILFDAMEELEELYQETNYKYNINVISDVDGKELTFYKNVSYPGGNSYYIENPEYSEVAKQLFHNPENIVKTKALTLDTIRKTRGFPYPDLIKIDVQGAEIDVLRGATDILKHTKHLIVELQHEQYNVGANLCSVSIPIIESMGIVLDPYSGSGTVALAAKLFGCNYCGIDISPNYTKMAEDRLKNSNDYIDIFNKEIEKHVIKGITYQERKKKKEDKLNGTK